MTTQEKYEARCARSHRVSQTGRTIGRPETVTRYKFEKTITVEMSVETAAFVAAVLGNTNSYEVIGQYGDVISPFYELSQAVHKAGQGSLQAEFSRNVTKWEATRGATRGALGI